MIKDIYKQILAGEDVRANLIELRKLLKDHNNRRGFLYYLAGDFDGLYELLAHEDAKVRKNVALIMGELGEQEFMKSLYYAYNKEEKLFVKSDYLTAISHLDYRPLVEDFKKRVEVLTTTEHEPTSMKHINEEVRVLTEMILTMDAPYKHEFVGYNKLSDLILLTNREHQEITKEQIKQGIAKVFNAGVLVRTKDLKEVLAIRTYSEMLFRLKDALTVPNDPDLAAKALMEGGLLEFLKERHKGDGAFYFRLELKTKMPLDKKSALAKKMALKMEQLSDRALINSTSNYEVEVRLIENKEGAFNVLLKLYTINDERFKYRKFSVAASINPVTAALVAELAKDYLKPEAQVLDPFCGVGTMLIERNKLVPATPMYGIDIFGEAILKASQNAKRAEVIINFINRDFFDFKHEYLFDEIFTNMPAQGGRKTDEEMNELYAGFFHKAKEVLKQEAIIVMYTRDQHLVTKYTTLMPEYKVLQKYEISKKEQAYVYIIKYHK